MSNIKNVEILESINMSEKCLKKINHKATSQKKKKIDPTVPCLDSCEHMTYNMYSLTLIVHCEHFIHAITFFLLHN